MVTNSSMVTMESLQETTIALSNCAIADPLRPLLPPKTRVPYAPTYANGHISATSDPIHFMFGYRVGFSGTADLMALFLIRTNSRWRPPPSWIISNGHISTTAHDLLIQRASRGHLCYSTAFLLLLATRADHTQLFTSR